MNTYQIILITIFLAMNVLGLALMKIDKTKAIKEQRRIREAAFFLVAIFFGALGCVVGMFGFRHKTQHMSFRMGMPIIAIINVLFTAMAFRVLGAI